MKQTLPALAFALLFTFVRAAATDITGTLQNPDGTPLNGIVEFTLSQPARTLSPPVLYAPVRVTCTVTNGQIDAGCSVVGNDSLDPAGTYYRVRVLDSNNVVVLPPANYTLSGAAADLGSLPVTSVATLVPPDGNVTGNLSVSGNLSVAGTTTAGPLGVGVAPSTQLQVKGDATFKNESDTALTVTLDAGSTAGQSRILRFSDRGSSQAQLDVDSAGTLRVRSGSIVRMAFGNPGSSSYLSGGPTSPHDFANSLAVTRVRIHGEADKISFGSAFDTNLYRSAANTLKTDDSLVVTGALTVGSATISSGTGAPVGACSTGSLFLRIDGGVGSTLYVCEAGVWTAK